MNIFEIFSKSVFVNRHNAPGLVAAVEDIARKGKTTVPAIALTKTRFANAAYHPASNTMFVTEGILKCLNSENLHLPPSPEMMAVLAHEMGHRKFVFKQCVPMMALLSAIPLAGMAALYFVDKTNEKIKKEHSASPEKHAESFWKTFDEVVEEEKKKGAWQAWKDFASHCNPLGDKLGLNLYGDPSTHHDLSWGQTLMEQGKQLAAQTALLVPALYACRPIALANEFECDRFAVAVTQDKEAYISALRKLTGNATGTVIKTAKTPLQKTWAQKIGHALDNLLQNTIMAHPEMAERLAAIEKLYPEQAARAFHL